MFKKSALCFVLFIPALAIALSRDDNKLFFIMPYNSKKSIQSDSISSPIQYKANDEEYECIALKNPENTISYRRIENKNESLFDTTYGKSKIYFVRKGETLYSIARKFNIDVNNLASYNSISPHQQLRIGQKLKIPSHKNFLKNHQKNNNHEQINRPIHFTWPVRTVRFVHLDDVGGTRPLGIIIESQYSTSVLCSAKGIVEKIGEMRGFGRYVIIKHKHHYLTIYSGLKDIFVEEGEEVPRGKKIATHDGTLHFQINHGGKPLNPLDLLKPKKVNF